MNLTELQIQLRSVEEQMAVLQTEIEKMKPKPESEKKLFIIKLPNWHKNILLKINAILIYQKP